MDINEIEKFKANISVKEAKHLQTKLSAKVIQKNGFKKLSVISGIDLSVIKEQKKLISGIVSFSYPGMEIIERVSRVVDETFPYIPGLLSFREGPAILQTLEELNHKPDLMVFDGQGIAHPRGLGIASFIGVLTGIPSFGIAKKKLFGDYTEPDVKAGSVSNLYHPEDKSIIGSVVRTKTKVKPVFVSVGHKISLDKSVELALEFTRGYRLPEPTRQAHLFVNEVRREMLGK